MRSWHKVLRPNCIESVCILQGLEADRNGNRSPGDLPVESDAQILVFVECTYILGVGVFVCASQRGFNIIECEQTRVFV